MLSMSASPPPNPASRSRQKRVGDALRLDTRNRILEAAAEEFSAHGYTGTTVTRLASAAGVSVQTLYLAWGSKRALLRGYMESRARRRPRIARRRQPAIHGLGTPATGSRNWPPSSPQ